MQFTSATLPRQPFHHSTPIQNANPDYTRIKQFMLTDFSLPSYSNSQVIMFYNHFRSMARYEVIPILDIPSIRRDQPIYPASLQNYPKPFEVLPPVDKTTNLIATHSLSMDGYSLLYYVVYGQIPALSNNPMVERPTWDTATHNLFTLHTQFTNFFMMEETLHHPRTDKEKCKDFLLRIPDNSVYSRAKFDLLKDLNTLTGAVTPQRMRFNHIVNTITCDYPLSTDLTNQTSVVHKTQSLQANQPATSHPGTSTQFRNRVEKQCLACGDFGHVKSDCRNLCKFLS